MEDTSTAKQKILDTVANQWDKEIPRGGFGAVIAHAGVGKTALLVQLALTEIVNGRHVLHISMDDPLKKVDLWYREMFQHLVGQELSQATARWGKVLLHRFIMIFQADRFTVPRLEERLAELIEQKIFSPELIIVDGLHFDKSTRDMLLELQSLAKRHSLKIWFTVHAHRHEEPMPNGMPPGFGSLVDLFSLVWQIKQEGATLSLNPLVGASPTGKLFLDPVTMLVKD